MTRARQGRGLVRAGAAHCAQHATRDLRHQGRPCRVTSHLVANCKTAWPQHVGPWQPGLSHGTEHAAQGAWAACQTALPTPLHACPGPCPAWPLASSAPHPGQRALAVLWVEVPHICLVYRTACSGSSGGKHPCKVRRRARRRPALPDLDKRSRATALTHHAFRLPCLLDSLHRPCVAKAEKGMDWAASSQPTRVHVELGGLSAHLGTVCAVDSFQLRAGQRQARDSCQIGQPLAWQRARAGLWNRATAH